MLFSGIKLEVGCTWIRLEHSKNHHEVPSSSFLMSKGSLVNLFRVSGIFMNRFLFASSIGIVARFLCSFFYVDYGAEDLARDHSLDIGSSFLIVSKEHLGGLPLVSFSRLHGLLPGDKDFSDKRSIWLVGLLFVSLHPEFSVESVSLSVLILAHDLSPERDLQVEVLLFDV